MNKPNIWIFSLEPLDSRYTEQWHRHIPEILQSNKYNVHQIDGLQKSTSVTAGAFLNFSDTNRWKSSQLMAFLDLFDQGKTTVNDKFLFTDAWNPCVTQIAYMRDLLDQNWELHGIWHAGAYDPSDILGLKMKKPWPWLSETSWYHCYDFNYFATNFHRDMFLKNLGITDTAKAFRSGQPHGEIVRHMEQFSNPVKIDSDQIIWPHRYNSDKQPQIAINLQSDFNILITQQHKFTKAQYYQKLSESRIIFSCALHENLGISVMEGVLANVIPVLPDRCSYSEMYLPEFKYPSAWTESWSSFNEHRSLLVDFIRERLANPDKFKHLMIMQKAILLDKYLKADVMVNNLIK